VLHRSEDIAFDQKRLGQAIRLIREEFGITLAQLGAACSLAHTSVLRTESGEVDISLEKFVRMSLALGYPPGLLIESALLVSREIFHVGAFNEPRIKALSKSFGDDDWNARKKLADFTAGSALAVSYMLKSQDPKAMAERFEYPLPRMKDRFVNASPVLKRIEPMMREGFIELLIIEGTAALDRLGLFCEADAMEYVRLALQKRPEDGLPWTPRPRPDFIPDAPVSGEKPFSIELRIKELMTERPELARKSRLARDSKNQLWVDNIESPATNASVSSIPKTWLELLERVRLATSESGTKSRLASELRTSRQNVSKWLKGIGAPSAELTVRLLDWVTEEERKQKRPGSGKNTARAKAQSGKKKHDNSRPSDPPKR
jgi:transcriptional regulator with XRE-family HTH domain